MLNVEFENRIRFVSWILKFKEESGFRNYFNWTNFLLNNLSFLCSKALRTQKSPTVSLKLLRETGATMQTSYCYLGHQIYVPDVSTVPSSFQAPTESGSLITVQSPSPTPVTFSPLGGPSPHHQLCASLYTSHHRGQHAITGKLYSAHYTRGLRYLKIFQDSIVLSVLVLANEDMWTLKCKLPQAVVDVRPSSNDVAFFSKPYKNITTAIWVRTAAIKKTENYKCWRECGEIERLLPCWWEYKMVQSLWK